MLQNTSKMHENDAWLDFCRWEQSSVLNDAGVAKPRNLKDELKRNGYTLKATARALGISYFTLCRRMNYQTDFKLSELKTLSDLTGLSIQELCRIPMRG